MWCMAELDQEYLGGMEDVLALYEKPLSETEPVLCIDEKPVVLHGERTFPERSTARFGGTSHPGGVDLRTVQQWLGHSDMESTMRYLKPSRSQHRSEEHTSELQSLRHLVCRLL